MKIVIKNKKINEQEYVEDLSGGNIQPKPMDAEDQAQRETKKTEIVSKIKILNNQLQIAKENVKTLPKQIADLNAELGELNKTK